MKTNIPSSELLVIRRAIVESQGVQEFLGKKGLEMIIFPNDTILFKQAELSFPLTLLFKKEEGTFSMEMIFLEDGKELDSAKKWIKPQEAVIGEELFYSEFWTGRPALHADLGQNIGAAIDRAIDTMTGFFFHYFSFIQEAAKTS